MKINLTLNKVISSYAPKLQYAYIFVWFSIFIHTVKKDLWHLTIFDKGFCSWLSSLLSCFTIEFEMDQSGTKTLKHQIKSAHIFFSTFVCSLNSSFRFISISLLHISQCFHIIPIITVNLTITLFLSKVKSFILG